MLVVVVSGAWAAACGTLKKISKLLHVSCLHVVACNCEVDLYYSDMLPSRLTLFTVVMAFWRRFSNHSLSPFCASWWGASELWDRTCGPMWPLAYYINNIRRFPQHYVLVPFAPALKSPANEQHT